MDNNAVKVSEAFSKQARHFDDLNDENKLSVHLRTQFRAEVMRHLKPGSHILELNGGTGIDAIYFAAHGHDLLHTDNAPGMIAEAQQKIKARGLQDKVRSVLCSYHNLDQLGDEKFDHIISNFGGLNCTGDLKDVLRQFSHLLTPKGMVTLVVMPVICPWELLVGFKGKFGTAFRRFKKSTTAHIEGTYFSCYYYNPGYIIKALRKDFDLVTVKGVSITVPPEFYQNFVERYPRLYTFFAKLDHAIGGHFPFNRLCDHYIITLRLK